MNPLETTTMTKQSVSANARRGIVLFDILGLLLAALVVVLVVWTQL
jgi:hypothetical protein